MALFAAAGPGPVRAVRCLTGGHDCTVPAQRSASGRGLRRVSGRAGVGGARWTESGPRLPDDARVGLALDSNRELVAATFAPSTGSLTITRRKDEPGLALTAWQQNQRAYGSARCADMCALTCLW